MLTAGGRRGCWSVPQPLRGPLRLRGCRGGDLFRGKLRAEEVMREPRHRRTRGGKRCREFEERTQSWSGDEGEGFGKWKRSKG